MNPNEQVGMMRNRIAQDAVVIARLHETIDALRRRLLETQLVATATVCSMQLEIEQLRIDALDDALAEAGMGSSGERAVAVTPIDIWNLS